MKKKKTELDEIMDEQDIESSGMNIPSDIQDDDLSKLNEQKEQTKDLIFELFRLCDQNVPTENWNKFMISFKSICKDYGYKLDDIYFSTESEDRIAKWELKYKRSW